MNRETHRIGTAGPLLAITLFCVGWAAPECTADVNSAARQHYAAAQEAQNAGQLDTAAEEYRKVVQLAPDAAEAWASLGLVYNAQRRYPDSIKALATAEKLKPGLPGVSLYLGIDYIREHQDALAVPHLQKAIHVEPTNEQVYSWLSEAYGDQGKLGAAIDPLRRASLLFPDDPALLLNLSRLYRRAANKQIADVLRAASGPLRHQVFADIYKDEHIWQNARAHYYKALDEDPNWHGAHFGIAEIALANQQLDAAADEYHKELKVDSHSGAALARLAEIAFFQGRAADGLRLLNAAVDIAPDAAAHALGLPPSYPPEQIHWSDEVLGHLRDCIPSLSAEPPGEARSLSLAVVDRELGKNDESATYWNDFVAHRPVAAPGSQFAAAVRSYNRLDLDAAEEEFRGWLAIHPHDDQARYLLGRTWQTHSFSVMAQLLASSPNSAPAHEAMAEIYRENQKNDSSLEEYLLAERAAPRTPGLHLAVGSLLLQMHRPDEAMKELQAELELNPDSVGANQHVGEIYLDRSNPDKAIPYLERAVQQDSTLWSARQQLGKAFILQKNFTQAALQLQQVLSHDSDGSAHFQLGLAYKGLGEDQKARQQFDQSRAIKIRSLAHAESELSTFQSLSQ